MKGFLLENDKWVIRLVIFIQQCMKGMTSYSTFLSTNQSFWASLNIAHVKKHNMRVNDMWNVLEMVCLYLQWHKIPLELEINKGRMPELWGESVSLLGQEGRREPKEKWGKTSLILWTSGCRCFGGNWKVLKSRLISRENQSLQKWILVRQIIQNVPIKSHLRI